MTISKVDIQFEGAILQQENGISPNIEALNQEWLLPIGEQFRQEYWSLAKQKLLTSLLVERYPNARISNSKAEINLETHRVALTVEVDSG
ncbi:MAG TPA: outer membrane protein assembly factor, partial [Methylotenera sp.]|nr:outer membrane protein assembly factor [Methylotenera sp.]